MHASTSPMIQKDLAAKGIGHGKFVVPFRPQRRSRLQAAAPAASRSQTAQPAAAGSGASRRELLFALTAAPWLLSLPGGLPAAAADVLVDATRSVMRPGGDDETNIVRLLDARGTLLELQRLAATPTGSDERFRARRILPGMAKRLRELGPTVPQLAALAKPGADVEATLSREYGGTGGEDLSGGAVPIYVAIGNVITISGRTIQKEAQSSPDRAAAAVSRIDDLIAALPDGLVSRGKAIRAARVQ